MFKTTSFNEIVGTRAMNKEADTPLGTGDYVQESGDRDYVGNAVRREHQKGLEQFDEHGRRYLLVVERTGDVFGAVQAQILVPVFGRVKTAETYNELLDLRGASAGHVVFGLDIGDLNANTCIVIHF